MQRGHASARGVTLVDIGTAEQQLCYGIVVSRFRCRSNYTFRLSGHGGVQASASRRGRAARVLGATDTSGRYISPSSQALMS